MRALALLVLLLPLSASAISIGNGGFGVRPSGAGSVPADHPLCRFAIQFPSVSGGQFVCDSVATNITTARAGTATCIGGGTVASGVACVSAGGLECFAAGTGGRTAADVHTAPTTGWPVASGRIRFRFTPQWSATGGNYFVLIDTRNAGGTLGYTIYIHPSGGIILNSISGGAVSSSSGYALAWVAGQEYEVDVTWGGGTWAVKRDGAVIHNPALVAPDGIGTTARFGSNNAGALFANGSFRIIRAGAL